MDWQINTDYFKIDINCKPQNINWSSKELTILEQHEFMQIIVTHYDCNSDSDASNTNNTNDLTLLYFALENGISMAEIKSHWLENCNVLFRDFKIDVDYFIAPMYIYKNIIQLGIFIYNDKLASKFKIIIGKYTFMSQIQSIDSSIKLATRMAKYLKIKKERFANEDTTVSNYGKHNVIKEKWKNINIFNGIIDYSKRMTSFWKENYFVSSSKKKILWQHIFYNIRNYLPKLKCKIILQN